MQALLDRLLTAWQPLSYAADIDNFALDLAPDSRRSLLEAYDTWVALPQDSSERRACVVYGHPASGKSTLAAALCRHRNVHACHFFKAADESSRSTVRMLQSLAYQLASSIPALSQAYEKLDPHARYSDEFEAFKALLQQPLAVAAAEGALPDSVVVLIDALDQALQAPGLISGPLSSVLLNQFSSLPHNVRLFITSRPDEAIVSGLRHQYQPYAIGPDDARHAADLQELLAAQVRPRLSNPEYTDAAVQVLVSKSQGSCAYLPLLLQQLEAGSAWTFAEVKSLPDGMRAVYERQFSKAFAELDAARLSSALAVLQLVAAAKEPPTPAQLQSWMASVGASSVEADIMPLLSPLLACRGGCVLPAHTSVCDWLQDSAAAGKFYADAALGHARIADTLAGDLSKACSASVYNLRYSLYHLLVAERLEAVESLLLDFDYWQLVFDAGFGPDIVQELVSQQAVVQKSSHAARDAVRWLLWNSADLHSNPQLVQYRAVEAPKASAIHKAARQKFGGQYQILGGATQWGRLLRCMSGHSGAVQCLAFSPDGRLIASGGGSSWFTEDSGDSSVRFWDTVTGRQVGCMEGHSAGVRCLSFSPDGRRLASGSADCTLRVSDPITSQQLHCLEGHAGGIECLCYSADGRWIASGSHDYTARVWDASSGMQLCCLSGHTRRVICLSFSHDGQWLATGSADKTVRLWDPSSGQQLQCLEGHTDLIRCLSFSHDGRWLASGSNDKTVRLFNPSTGRKVRTLEGHTGRVECLVFSHDGRWLASGAVNDARVRLWDPISGQQEHSLKGHSQSVRCVSFSPDGQWLASGSDDGTARLWDSDSGQQLSCLEAHAEVSCLAISPDAHAVVTGSQDGLLRLWQADPSSSSSSSVGSRPPESHSSGVLCLAYSPDGRWLASGSQDGTLRLWHATSGQQLHVLQGQGAPFFSVAFSSDTHFLACGSYEVSLLDVISGKALHSFQSHTEPVSCLAFSPDTRWLVYTTENALHIYNPATGKRSHCLEGHRSDVLCLSVSPDACLLASGSDDHTLRLWEPISGRPLHCLEGHGGPVRCCTFSPSSRLLVAGSGDHLLRLWNPVNGQQMLTMKGHAGGIACLAFSPDGRWLASGSVDATVRLWDPFSGQQLQVLEGHADEVSVLEFSSDSRWLATGSHDSTVRVIEPATGKQGGSLQGLKGCVRCVAFSPDACWLASGCDDGLVRLYGAPAWGGAGAQQAGSAEGVIAASC